MPRRMYRTARRHRAATAIQRIARGYLSRKGFRSTRRTQRTGKRTGFLAVQQVHTEITTIPAAGGSEDVYVDNLKFNIASIPNLDSYRRLFDQYRIKKVKVRIVQQSGFDNPSMTLITSIDLDAGTAPTTSDLLLQCSNSKIKNLTAFRPSKVVSIFPRFQNKIVMDAAAGTENYTLGRPGAWLDLADAGLTNHHGLNIAFTCPDSTGLTNPASINYEFTYHIEFRKIR